MGKIVSLLFTLFAFYSAYVYENAEIILTKMFCFIFFILLSIVFLVSGYKYWFGHSSEKEFHKIFMIISFINFIIFLKIVSTII